MAVYYVSPFTATNGTGTFASPFSMHSTSRTPTNLTAGDEVRVISRELTSLLTATSYTATITAYNTVQITAGGGLGGDFAAFDICYLPDTGAFFKITSKSTNSLSISANGVIPWYNSTAGQSFTLRKVDLTSFSPASTANSCNIWNTSNVPDNITVTDGWVSDGVRVTDGTAKSLVNTNSTSTAFNFTDFGASGTEIRTNCVIDMAHTSFVPGNSTSGGCNIYLNMGGATYTIGQIFTNSSTISLNLRSSGSPFYDGSVTVKNLSNYGSVFNGTAEGTTLTVENMGVRYLDFLLYSGGSGTLFGAKDCTINISNILGGAFGSGSQLFYGVSPVYKNTFNINNYIDSFAATAPSSIVGAFGDYTVNFSSSFTFWRNRRTATTSSFTNKLGAISGFSFAGDLKTPIVNLPSGWTATTNENLNALAPPSGAILGSQFYKIPRICKFHVSAPLASSVYPRTQSNANLNFLITHENGSNPIEILCPFSAVLSSITGSTQNVVATLDDSTFRTAAPSLQINLTARNAAQWNPIYGARARKTIKIPATSGLAYTVSGYIRNNITSFANGDVRVCVVNKEGNEVTGQNMTTASNSAWEQFTLNFTAAETAEYHLVVEVYYVNTGSVWLDDLTIS